MKIIDEIIGKTTSASESSHVALNATQEAYVYLEAERKDELGPLLRRAAEILERDGTDPQTAFNIVATRGQYIKDMSRGSKLFHQASAEIKAEPKTVPVSVKTA